VTALAEIVGCYLPYLGIKKGGSAWLLPPAAVSLAAFTWLFALDPHAAGRVHAAYVSVYVGVAIAWLWIIDSIQPTFRDCTRVSVSLIGIAIIIFGSQRA
jgi:small multidrug resistance family-3 protein